MSYSSGLYVFPRVRIAPVAVPLRCMPALVLSGRFLPLFLLAGGVLVSAACRQERARVCVLRSAGALFLIALYGEGLPLRLFRWCGRRALRDWRRSWLVVGSWWLGVGPSRRFATCPFGDFAYRSFSFLLLVVWESGRRGCRFYLHLVLLHVGEDVWRL